MSRNDALNAADNIREGFREMGTPAFDRDMRELDKRHDDERNYGLGGVVAVIAGLALFPYKAKSNNVGTVQLSEQSSAGQ